MTTEEATSAVSMGLFKEVQGLRHVWESLAYTSLEDFKTGAIRTLGDVTDLDFEAFNGCNWEELYEYFKDLKESD
jgi:hypothetical protein